MKILRADRGQGKTTKLVKISNKEWKYIVCLNTRRADTIVKIAKKLGLDIPYPITIDELPIRQGSYIKNVLIDDIEDVLQYIVGRGIDYATTSCEVEELPSEHSK